MKRQLATRWLGFGLLWLIVLLWSAAASASATEGDATVAQGLPPEPAYLIAEPTPSDDGTHVTVRWPRAETERTDFRYVVYISRDPGWRWSVAATPGPDQGFVTSPAVSPYYPYRFSPGDEHYQIIRPLDAPGMQGHWLPAARRYVRWLTDAGAKLQECESSLAALKDQVEEQRTFLKKLSRYRPLWEQRLQRPGERRRRLAGYLESAEERQKGMAAAILSGRDAILGQIAEYALLDTLLDLESAVAAEEVRQKGLPSIEQALKEAAEKLETEQSSAEDCDRYERLDYILGFALARGIHPDGSARRQEIAEEVMGRLAALLSEARLPAEPTRPDEEAEAIMAEPDSAALAEALKNWHAALANFQRDESEEAEKQWAEAQAAMRQARRNWLEAMRAAVYSRFAGGDDALPRRSHLREEMSRLRPLLDTCAKRLEKLEGSRARRQYYFRLGLMLPSGERTEPFDFTVSAAASPNLFDFAKLVNVVYAVGFAAAVLFMVAYVRRHPDVFVRRIAGLEAVDEAIGRATEMGKPVLFVHGLTGIGDIAVLASINILSRLSRQVAEYDSDLLVVNSDPIVYSLSQEVVQQAYLEAGRPDAFNPDNVFMAASRQFPYVAAVAGIMARRQPAANFFMGYFFAESLILAEAGARTGAIQIAATDAFTQLPFFITTCDYTLMGEELYAASAYLSRDARMLATLKAQDLGKAVLLAALPLGVALSNLGRNWIEVIFTAYEKGF